MPAGVDSSFRQRQGWREMDCYEAQECRFKIFSSNIIPLPACYSIIALVHEIHLENINKAAWLENHRRNTSGCKEMRADCRATYQQLGPLLRQAGIVHIRCEAEVSHQKGTFLLSAQLAFQGNRWHTD